MKKLRKNGIGLFLASIMLILQTACSMVILEEPSHYETKPEPDKRVEVQSSEVQSVADTASTDLVSDLPVEGNSYVLHIQLHLLYFLLRQFL